MQTKTKFLGNITTLNNNSEYIEIGEMRNIVGGYKEVLVDPYKKVFEEVDVGVGTHEVICGSSNYQDIFGGSCLIDVNIMVYDMLDET